jgi:hypothetical protein
LSERIIDAVYFKHVTSRQCLEAALFKAANAYGAFYFVEIGPSDFFWRAVNASELLSIAL